MVVLYNVPWATYEALLELLGDRRFRHSYDGGTLEIMSPSRAHEKGKKLLARMIERMAEELDMDIESVGSTTQRKESARKGLEPDECYYFANEPAVRGKETYDAEIDPPPDLAVEVDVTHSSVDRLDIYAANRIPEVWRYDGETMSFYRRTKAGKYVKTRKSLTFPFLTPPDLEQFLDQRYDRSERTLLKEFLKRVRRQGQSERQVAISQPEA